jgi:hypothetical protein
MRGLQDLMGDMADRFQLVNRERKAARIIAWMSRHELTSVLLVGTGHHHAMPRKPWEGLVERAVLAQATYAVLSGFEVGPSEVPYVACDGRRLPFADGAFDLVVSNAVIEHVGDEDEQRVFLAEHARVGRFWVATTPNRSFPVESHTRSVLLHYRRSWRERQPSFTRLVNRAEFARLLPAGGELVGAAWAPTFIATNARRRRSR